jgi:cell wall-associated NlpC family hydrolase
VTDGRKHITRLLATLFLTVLGGSMLVASPSRAEPEIEDVQARVDALYHEAEIASERFNEAREDLRQAQARLQTVRSDLDRKQEQVEEIRRQVVSAVVAQSQGQVFSSATQVAISDSPDAFLERLVVVSQYNEQQNEMKAQFATQARQLDLRQEAAERELTQIAKAKRDLATQKATIDEKASQAEDLLSRLKTEAAAERAEAASRALEESRTTSSASAPTPQSPTPTATAPSTSSVSGRAGAAVDYALAQVGDAYVWGAAGPDAFDCSGLTLMAWQQAGVNLPHSSSQQMSSGTPVSQSQLQPGDLVFYYSPVSHVGIYVGNGKIVHAANPGDGVTVAPLLSMPYSGAVRPG